MTIEVRLSRTSNRIHYAQIREVHTARLKVCRAQYGGKTTLNKAQEVSGSFIGLDELP